MVKASIVSVIVSVFNIEVGLTPVFLYSIMSKDHGYYGSKFK